MKLEHLVPDELWEAVEVCLPRKRPNSHGRPRIPDRAALAGIVYILRGGLRWRDLPASLGFGSGITCWRRLREWQSRGVWAAVHRVLLNWLGDLDAIDLGRASVDSTSIRAKKGAMPPDRTRRTEASGGRSTT